MLETDIDFVFPGLVSGYLAKSANYTVTSGDRSKIIDCTGTFTLSLPAVSASSAGFTILVRNASTGVITVDPNGSDTINGSATARLDVPRGEHLITWNGAAWYCTLLSTPFLNVRDLGALGDNIADDTAEIQAALDASLSVYIPDGTYRLSDQLTLRSGHTILLSSGATLRQYTADKNILRAVSRDNVTILCNGAVFYGQGAWSSGWTSNSGHEDRAIQLLGCTRCVIDQPTIKNCASAGISIMGGSRIRINVPSIEGTHAYGVPLSAGNNFQNGIYLANDATYGALNGVEIVAPDISDVCQGILKESPVGATQATIVTNIISPNIHDIRGQHGVYYQDGKCCISSPALSNIANSGIKWQSSNAGDNFKDFTCLGATASVLGSGSAFFEMSVLSTGSLQNVMLSGTVRSAGYGLTVTGKVLRLNADLVCESITGNAVSMSGADQKDIDIRVKAKDVTQDGIIITSTNSSGIRLWPVLRECNVGNDVSSSGIRVVSASATVDIYDPDVTDTNTRQVYGLWNATNGGIVRVHGSAVFTGASDVAVRAVGKITEFPTEATLSGTNGAWYLGYLRSSQEIFVSGQSTSASNVSLWVENMEDESAYFVEYMLVGKLSGSAQRRAVKGHVCVYRDGGGNATVEGNIDIDIVSSGFAGLYTMTGNGAEGVTLLVNSGGVATYDWRARITVTRVF